METGMAGVYLFLGGQMFSNSSTPFFECFQIGITHRPEVACIDLRVAAEPSKPLISKSRAQVYG